MIRFFSKIHIALITCLIASFGTLSQADTLPSPTGEVVLHVFGEISHTNSDDSATFDLAMLEALPSTTVITSTIWTVGEQEFVGVELGTLLDHVGAKGSTIDAHAINDYLAEIPIQDAAPGSALIAYQRNGQSMSVREKGPLWIIYPYDEARQFRSEVFYARSVWQLNRLEVLR